MGCVLYEMMFLKEAFPCGKMYESDAVDILDFGSSYNYTPLLEK